MNEELSRVRMERTHRFQIDRGADGDEENRNRGGNSVMTAEGMERPASRRPVVGLSLRVVATSPRSCFMRGSIVGKEEPASAHHIAIR
jgi:hypothetical protein